MAINDFSNQNIQDTYQKVIQTDGTNVADGTGSLLPISFDGNDIIIPGAVRAQSYIVSESITSVSSGSTIFGNSADDIHQLTGSLKVLGTITASGDISGSLIRGDRLVALNTIAIKAGGVETTIADFVGNVFEFGNSTTQTSISGSIIKLNAESDIICDIGGGDLRLNKSDTEFFRFNLDPNPKIDVTGDLIIDPSGNNVHLSDASLVVTGSITASGNISASGNINAGGGGTGSFDHIITTGDTIEFKNGGTKLGIIKADAAGSITFGNNDGTKNAAIKVSDIGVTSPGHNIRLLSGHITASGNISASGDVYADDYFCNNNLMMGYDIASGTQLFGESTSKTFLSATNIKLDAPVTASGNISASGEVSALTMKVGGLTIRNHSDMINFPDAQAVRTVNGYFTGDITASGDISSSGIITAEHFESSDDITAAGTIQAEQLTSTDDASVAGDLVLGTAILHSGDIDTKIAFDTDQIDLNTGGSVKIRLANTLNTLNQDTKVSGDLEVTSHITASGTISASRLISRERLYDIANPYSGDIVTFGSGPGGVNGDIVQGELYYYSPQTYWTKTDADTVVSSSGMLGIAVADDTPTFLVKGIIHSGVFSGFTTGDVLYASTSSGDVQNSAPNGNGDIVRVVGYSIDGDNRIIYFDPDKTFIEVNA